MESGRCLQHGSQKHARTRIKLPKQSAALQTPLLLSHFITPSVNIKPSSTPCCLSVLEVNLLLLADVFYFCSLCSWSLKVTSCRAAYREENLCVNLRRKDQFAHLHHTGSSRKFTWLKDSTFLWHFLLCAAWRLQVSLYYCYTCYTFSYIQANNLINQRQAHAMSLSTVTGIY